MELVKTTIRHDFSIQGADFKGETEIVDNSVKRLYLEIGCSGEIHDLTFVNEQQIRDLHGELSQLITFVDNLRKNEQSDRHVSQSTENAD